MSVDPAVHESCKDILQLCRLCCGPHGRSAGVLTVHDCPQHKASALVLDLLMRTSSSSEETTTPSGKRTITKIICDVGKNLNSHVGDGGWFTVFLITSFIERYQASGDMHLFSVIDQLYSLQEVLSRQFSKLEFLPLFTNRAHEMVSIAKIPFQNSSMCLTDSTITQIAVLAVKMFLSSIGNDGVHTHNVRVLCISRLPTLPCCDDDDDEEEEEDVYDGGEIVDGVLLPWTMPPEIRIAMKQQKHSVARKRSVLLFDCGLQPSENDSDNDDLALLRGVFRDVVHNTTGNLFAVMSQRVIHPALKYDLTKQGVLVIERLSILHIRSVQMLSGAPIISSWRTMKLNESLYGTIDSIEPFTKEKGLFSHSECTLLRRADSNIKTVVLYSPLEEYQAEMEHNFRRSLLLLKWAMVPGQRKTPAGVEGLALQHVFLHAIKLTDVRSTF
eukprot:PhF_6_TR34736/c1_g1_i1/m.50555/K09492/MKKS; McKusick-Kaufman syndrome protein